MQFNLIKKMEYRISEISPEETRPLRLQVLRPGFTLEAVCFEEDIAPDSFHLGLFIEEELVCTASFFATRNLLFEVPSQYQLRGMATHPDHRNKNAGKFLMEEGIRKLQNKNAELLWCNGRLVATSFYERLGFKLIGEEFLSINIPHKIMYLDLRGKEV